MSLLMHRWCAVSLLVSAALFGAEARAQCSSNASSCVGCHEVRGLRPVLQSSQRWHVDHGFGDLCAACHGGDRAATTQELAHAGIRSPLQSLAASCEGCHASDYQQRAQRYLTARPQTSAPRPSPVAATRQRTPSRVDAVLALTAVALALANALVRWKRSGSVRPSLASWLRAKEWSPYSAGVLLGLVVSVSAVLCGRPIAVSGAFDRLAAYPGSWLFPRSQFYAHVLQPAITVQVWLVLGLLLGAFASSALSGEARVRWLPDTQWTERFGSERWKRIALAFVGSVLVQFGAGIAGGCTSGLAISGGAVFAPGAFVFMAGMFAGGIPAAMLWYRGRNQP